MATLTAPSFTPRRAAASAWEMFSVSPVSQGLSASKCSAFPAASCSWASAARARSSSVSAHLRSNSRSGLGALRVGQLQAGRGVGPRLERFQRLAGAAFQAVGVLAHVGQEMFDRAQAGRNGTGLAPAAPLSKPCRASRRAKNSCVSSRAASSSGALAADEGKDRRVIGGAQIAQAPPSLPANRRAPPAPASIGW